MKKIIAILLCLVMVLSVTACQTAEEAPAADEPAAEESAAAEETQTEDPAAAEADDEDLLICCIAGEVGIPYFTTCSGVRSRLAKTWA